MKRSWLLLLLAVIVAVSVVGWGKETLVVYTYDSFISWGPGGALQQAFAAKYNCNLQFVTAGGAKATLARLIADRRNGDTQADIFMGELNDVPRISSYNLFLPVQTASIPNLRVIPTKLREIAATGLVPYEYGYITLTYDSHVMTAAALPKTLADLTAPRYRNMLICEDPRTSSTGFSFLLWTIAQFGKNGYLTFWRDLNPTILTITQGWSTAWTMLTHGEAPLMVSYSTDAAYAALSGKTPRYLSYTPAGEGYRTVYGVGIIRGTTQQKLAEEFINLLLSPQIQRLIPVKEAMFPVNPNAPIPAAFKKYAIIPKHELFLPLALVGKKAAQWLNDWAGVMTKQ